MSKNTNLHQAKAAKNDEFYTRLNDIWAECSKYTCTAEAGYRRFGNPFEGKTIYMPCDTEESKFFQYFIMNFEAFNIKKLILTHYNSDGSPSFKTEYTGAPEEGKYGRNGMGDIHPTRTPLEGDGDFRSPECAKLFAECDVVVTNPPFSLFREFMNIVMAHGKKFLVIGNKNAITYKEFFPLIKENKVWLGYTMPKDFILPDDQPISKAIFIDENGIKHTTVASCWFTNLPTTRRVERLVDNCLIYKYYEDPSKYPKYDNYDAINVDKTLDIPLDYFGVMGVPITFLFRYNPDEFEIVSFRKGEDGKDLVFTTERERVQPYFRILVRRRFPG